MKLPNWHLKLSVNVKVIVIVNIHVNFFFKRFVEFNLSHKHKLKVLCHFLNLFMGLFNKKVNNAQKSWMVNLIDFCPKCTAFCVKSNNQFQQQNCTQLFQCAQLEVTPNFYAMYMLKAAHQKSSIVNYWQNVTLAILSNN